MKVNVIVTSLAILFFCTNISSAQRTKQIKQTVDLTPDGRVSIETYKGSITVTTWDKPQVDIVAVVEPDGENRHNEEYVRETEIRIDHSAGIVRIESDYDRLKHHHSGSFFGIFTDDNLTLPFVRYTITMPKTSNLEIKDYKSDSHITNLHSRLRMETYKGTVAVQNLEGSINLETYKGEATIDLLKLTETSKVETEKGRIDITFTSTAGCELDMRLGRRVDLTSEIDMIVKRKQREEENYQSTINGGGPVLRIESEKGTIRLRKK
jgi:hypothetical protein